MSELLQQTVMAQHARYALGSSIDAALHDLTLTGVLNEAPFECEIVREALLNRLLDRDNAWALAHLASLLMAREVLPASALPSFARESAAGRGREGAS